MTTQQTSLFLGWRSTGAGAEREANKNPRKPLFRHNQPQEITYDGDGHLMTIAPTGAGKGTGVIIPNLLTYAGPVIVIDPKGENYAVTGRYRREVLGQQIYLLDPFGRARSLMSVQNMHREYEPAALNPLDLLWNETLLRQDESLAATFETDTQMLSEQLSPGHSHQDPIWDRSAKSLIAGMIAMLARHPDASLRNFWSISQLLADPSFDNRLILLYYDFRYPWNSRRIDYMLSMSQTHPEVVNAWEDIFEEDVEQEIDRRLLLWREKGHQKPPSRNYRCEQERKFFKQIDTILSDDDDTVDNAEVESGDDTDSTDRSDVIASSGRQREPSRNQLRSTIPIRAKTQLSAIERLWLSIFRSRQEVLGSSARRELGSYFSIDAFQTRSGVLFAARSYFTFLSEGLSPSISHTSPGMSEKVKDGDPSKGQTFSIYIVVPPEKLQSHAALLRLWLSTLITLMLRRSARPSLQTLLILDECAQLGTMPLLRQVVSLLRGFGVQAWMFFQDMSQLQQLYTADWKTLINNCGVFQCFGAPRATFSEDVAGAIGDLKSTDVQLLARDQQIISKAGEFPFRAGLARYFEDIAFRGRFDGNPYFEG